MSKLQLYFDYVDKYNLYDEYWYETLSQWVTVAQTIKKRVSAKDFTIFDEIQKKVELENILSECTQEIKTIANFCQRYLFESNNGVGTIRQQLITKERRIGIISQLENNPSILIRILVSESVVEVDSIVRELIQENVNSVINRFLRVIFPEIISSVDAPLRLDHRIHLIYAKLGISITGNSIIEKQQKLMNEIQSSDPIKKQIFFWDIYNLLDNVLSLKKALVYYGSPGTGKTFQAKAIAYQFIDQHRIKIEKENSKYQIKIVQFHPSYSYEDFMEGIRPDSKGNLSLFNGTFKSFCKTVGHKEIELYKDYEFINNHRFKEINYNFSLINVSELTENQKNILELPSVLAEGITISEVIEPAFFIIDEINRAELSRVFGELMFSLEYRGINGKIKTQYSYLNKDENAECVYFWDGGEDWFFIPQNLFLIGTMNNIDRSVDSFDFALRRRFMWIEIEPDFNIVRKLLDAGWKEDLVQAFENLNDAILSENLLGKDYRIGHSYALEIKPMQKRFETINEVKKFLWNEFINPLLEEYLRGLGDNKKAKEKLYSFEQVFGVK